jgi:hypothetical protein
MSLPRRNVVSTKKPKLPISNKSVGKQYQKPKNNMKKTFRKKV